MDAAAGRRASAEAERWITVGTATREVAAWRQTARAGFRFFGSKTDGFSFTILSSRSAVFWGRREPCSRVPGAKPGPHWQTCGVSVRNADRLRAMTGKRDRGRTSLKVAFAQRTGFALALCLCVLFFPANVNCQGIEKVSVCQLQKDPPAYNHKLVQVTAFVTHGFEDFSLLDPGCSAWLGIWLEYGGTTASGTMYCCGVTNARTRPKELVVEKIPIPLVDDSRFREFDRLIERRPDSIVHATIVGRFFAGRLEPYGKPRHRGGYGHMGCCSLLAIQQVLSIDPQDRGDLDYRGEPDQPDTNTVGCEIGSYQSLTPLMSFEGAIRAQRAADAGERAWTFNDPRRVALDFLARTLKVDRQSIQGLRETSQAQGRLIYVWTPAGKSASYMVEVSRPYWLSFYSRNPRRVAWVVLASYRTSCGEGP